MIKCLDVSLNINPLFEHKKCNSKNEKQSNNYIKTKKSIEIKDNEINK